MHSITKRKDQICPHRVVVNNLITLLRKLAELPALVGRDYQVRLFCGMLREASSALTEESFPAGLSSPRGQTPWAGSEYHVCGLWPSAGETLPPRRGGGGPPRVTLGERVCVRVCTRVTLMAVWSRGSGVSDSFKRQGGLGTCGGESAALHSVLALHAEVTLCESFPPSPCLFSSGKQKRV